MDTDELALVRAFLDELASDGVRAVLLHEPGRPLSEHDVDLAIDRPFEAAWPALIRCASRNGMTPVWRADYDVGGSTYVVFARTDGPIVERLALDLLPDLDGIGKYGVPIGTLLRSRSTRQGLLYPTPAWEATYLVAKQVWKGSWNSLTLERAAQLANEDVEAFERAANDVFGRRLARSLAARARSGRLVGSRSEARRLLHGIRVRRGLRCPWLPLLFAARFLHRATDPTGLFVVVCGPDGSGKSALTSSLLVSLGPLFRRQRRMHWRPGLLPRLGAVVNRPAPDGREPHAAAPYGRATSIARFLYYWADHVIGYWTKVWPVRVRSGLVVLERGYHDMLVDPLRYRLRVPAWLVRASTTFVPTPDLTLVLCGDPAVLHARKAELDVDEIADQVERWRRLARKDLRAHVIDATHPFADVLAESTSCALEASHVARRRPRPTPVPA